MEILNSIFYFVVMIGVLVLVHEFGHFAAAKLFGMRVDRFSVGFPPRAFGKKFGETDYCVSWIPIGGYVKIAGMIDESFDTDFINKEPQAWEFRAKPIWQRMVVLTAGVFMNILLAIAIFWGIIYFQGRTAWPTTEVGYVAENSPAAKAGLLKGDRILKVNGKPVRFWEDIETDIYVEQMGEDILLSVQRSGIQRDLAISRSEIPGIEEARFGILPKGVVPVVSTVDPEKPAALSGIKPGDIITKIGGAEVDFYVVPQTIKRYAAEKTEIEWIRDGTTMRSQVTPTAEGKIGISYAPRYTGPVEQMKYSLFGSMIEGVKEMIGASSAFIKNIRAIIVGSVSLSESVGGPVKIAQIATRSAQAGLASFLGVMAWLSLTLAILNLLPFPALDGGHLMFLAYEGIFRKEIPPKVKIMLQQTGFALLLVFMAFVLYNDIVHF